MDAVNSEDLVAKLQLAEFPWTVLLYTQVLYHMVKENSPAWLVDTAMYLARNWITLNEPCNYYNPSLAMRKARLHNRKKDNKRTRMSAAR